MRRPVSPLRHDALRDTAWPGKGVSSLLVFGMLLVAALLAWAFH